MTERKQKKKGKHARGVWAGWIGCSVCVCVRSGSVCHMITNVVWDLRTYGQASKEDATKETGKKVLRQARKNENGRRLKKNTNKQTNTQTKQLQKQAKHPSKARPRERFENNL